MHEIMDGWKTVGVRSSSHTPSEFSIVPSPNQRVVLTSLYVNPPSAGMSIKIIGSITGSLTTIDVSGAMWAVETTSSTSTATGYFRVGSNVAHTSSSGIGEQGYLCFEKGETVSFEANTGNAKHIDYQLQEEI